MVAAGLEEEESGWKYIHGDVFRFPPHKNLFCAFVGTGTQVCVVWGVEGIPAKPLSFLSPLFLQIFYLSLFIFALALIGAFYPYNRGGMYTALIIMYALTASIAGYVAASYYKQMEGELWVRNILLTCFVYCGPFFTTFAFLNTVAIAYRVREVVGVVPEGRKISGHADDLCSGLELP